MEELLLGALLPGKELNVVDQQDNGGSVLPSELVLAALGDRVHKVVGELLAGDIEDSPVLPRRAAGDGVQEVSLAEAGAAVDEQGVIQLARLLGYSVGGGGGQPV